MVSISLFLSFSFPGSIISIFATQCCLLYFVSYSYSSLYNSRSIGGMRNEIIQGQMKLKRIHRIIVDRDDPFIVVPIRTIQQDIWNEKIGDCEHNNAAYDTQWQTHHETNKLEKDCQHPTKENNQDIQRTRIVVFYFCFLLC
mmetsp:Transcript_64325/g.71893  ORF Transcript_64325/g.71893 Transcript_64325/m.71893 type:complete len:142 (-) Transcript_64325:263-688(-)